MESKVMSIIEGICAANNFLEYEYSPPKTVRACKALIDDFEEDIEEAFIKDKSDRENLICQEITKACAGVDMSSSKKPKDTADIDLSGEGEGDGKVVQKAVKFNPETGKVEPEKKPLKEGKTLSKSNKKKEKKKKTKSVSGKKERKKEKDQVCQW